MKENPLFLPLEYYECKKFTFISLARLHYDKLLQRIEETKISH